MCARIRGRGIDTTTDRREDSERFHPLEAIGCRLAAAAAVVPLAATASAAPTAADYTHATYLQHALGLPATNTNPVIESVTYDRFQWLLQQPGNFAFLIGDPALDPTFAARAQDVEAAAKAAGVKQVYWFDPNLSGSAKVGTDHRARARHPQLRRRSRCPRPRRRSTATRG